MEGFEKIKQLVADLQGDVNKAKGGNKTACVRVRAALQKVRDLAKEARVEFLNLKNS